MRLAADVRQQVVAALRLHFRPECLTRIDDIVLFKPLSLTDIIARPKVVDLKVSPDGRHFAGTAVTDEGKTVLHILDRRTMTIVHSEVYGGPLGVGEFSWHDAESLLITSTNVIEVGMWALFFVWKDAQPGFSTAFYNALLNYTTLQAGYLPQRWHLLEAGLGMAGMLTVAWSTGILYMLAQEFQDTQMQVRKRRRGGGSDAARVHDAMPPMYEKAC